MRTSDLRCTGNVGPFGCQLSVTPAATNLLFTVTLSSARSERKPAKGCLCGERWWRANHMYRLSAVAPSITKSSHLQFKSVYSVSADRSICSARVYRAMPSASVGLDMAPRSLACLRPSGAFKVSPNDALPSRGSHLLPTYSHPFRETRDLAGSNGA